MCKAKGSYQHAVALLLNALCRHKSIYSSLEIEGIIVWGRTICERSQKTGLSFLTPGADTGREYAQKLPEDVAACHEAQQSGVDAKLLPNVAADNISLPQTPEESDQNDINAKALPGAVQNLLLTSEKECKANLVRPAEIKISPGKSLMQASVTRPRPCCFSVTKAWQGLLTGCRVPYELEQLFHTPSYPDAFCSYMTHLSRDHF